MMDALAISDRFLQNGASDQLLQLLIERGEENISGQSQGHSGNNNWSHSWQYCLRLKDKQLAARLALKYVHKCLFFSVEVFIMCIMEVIWMWLHASPPLPCESTCCPWVHTTLSLAEL
ncbi:hypothetical protein KY290_034149 [Solanum tuberosum]|uniref:Uncharacterized protein n=1 Tax=Solanum tuberosum TaxID=4113 RepID=A0ABQ7U460_SOLTU|nr:hypothetical protein KY290_034149 [Solanum tuberosum]